MLVTGTSTHENKAELLLFPRRLAPALLPSVGFRFGGCHGRLKRVVGPATFVECGSDLIFQRSDEACIVQLPRFEPLQFFAEQVHVALQLLGARNVLQPVRSGASASASHRVCDRKLTDTPNFPGRQLQDDMVSRK